jgi:hypothetical protein
VAFLVARFSVTPVAEVVVVVVAADAPFEESD